MDGLWAQISAPRSAENSGVDAAGKIAALPVVDSGSLPDKAFVMQICNQQRESGDDDDDDDAEEEVEDDLEGVSSGNGRLKKDLLAGWGAKEGVRGGRPKVGSDSRLFARDRARREGLGAARQRLALPPRELRTHHSAQAAEHPPAHTHEPEHRRISVRSSMPSDVKLVPALAADENRREAVGLRLARAVRLDEHLIPEGSLLINIDGRDIRELASVAVQELIADARGARLNLTWLRPKTGTRKIRSKSSDGGTIRRRRRSFGLSNNLKAIWSGLQDLVQALDTEEELASLLRIPLTAQSEVVQPQSRDTDAECRQDEAVKRARVEDICSLLEELASQVHRRKADAALVVKDLSAAKESNARLAQRVNAQRELIDQLEGNADTEEAEEERKDGTLGDDSRHPQPGPAPSDPNTAALGEKLARVTQDLRTASAAKHFFEHKVSVLEQSLEAAESRLHEANAANEEMRRGAAQVEDQQTSIQDLEARHRAELEERLEEISKEHALQLQEMMSSLEAARSDKEAAATAREETLRAHVALLQQSLATKDRKVADLTQNLQHARDKLALYQEQQRKSSRSQSEVAAEELALWRRDANQLRSTVQELSARLQHADDQAALHKRNHASALQATQRFQEALQEAEARIKAASDDRAAAAKERDELAQRLHETERRAARSKTDSAQVRMEMEELRHLQAAQFAELETKYRNAHATPAPALRDAAESPQHVQKAKGVAEAEGEAMVREDLRAHLLRARSQAEKHEETNAILRDQVQILSDEVSRRAEELEALRSRAASEASSKFQTLLAKVEGDYERELELVHADLEEKGDALAELRGVLKTKQTELTSLREKFALVVSQSTSTREALERDLEEALASQAAEQTRAAELSARLNQALLSKRESEAGLHEAQRKLQGLQSTATSLEEAREEVAALHNVKTLLQTAEARLAQLEAERASAVAETEAASARASQAEADADAAREKLEEAEGLRTGLQRAQSEQQSFTHQIQADLNEQRRLCTSLRRELADAEQALHATRGALEAQEAKERQTSDMINRLVGQLDKAHTETRTTKLAIAERENQLQARDADASLLRAEADRLRADLQTKADALSRAESLRAQAESSAQRAALALDAKLQAREEQVEKLEGELDAARQALVRAERAGAASLRLRADAVDGLQRAASRLQMQQRHCREQTLAIFENFSSELAAALGSCKRRADDMSARHARQLAGLRGELRAAEERLRAQQAIVSTLAHERQEEVASLRQKLTDSKEGERAARRELAMAKTTLVSQQEEVSIADARVKASAETALALRTRVDELEDALEESRTASQRKALRLEGELARLRETHDIQAEACDALHTARKDAEDREAVVRELEQELSSLRAENVTLRARLDSARDDAGSAQRELESLQERFDRELERGADAVSARATLASRLKDARAEQTQIQAQADAQASRLQTQLARLRAALEDGKRSAGDADAAQQAAAKLREECAALHASVEEQRSLASSTRAQLLQREREYDHERREWQDVEAELRREVQNERTKLERQQSLLAGAQAEARDAQIRVAELEAKVEQLTSDMDNFVATHDETLFASTQECVKLREQVQSGTARERAEGERLAALEEHCKTLEKKLDEHARLRSAEDKAQGELLSRLEAAETQNNTLRRELEERANQGAQLAAAQNNYQQQLEDYRQSQLAQLEDLRAARQSDRAGLDEALGKVESLHAQLEQARAEREDLLAKGQSEKDELETELGRIRDAADARQAKEDELESRLATAQQMLVEATNREAAMQSKLEAQLLASFEERESRVAAHADVATQTTPDAGTCAAATAVYVSQSCQTSFQDDRAAEELEQVRALHRNELAAFLARVQEEITEERERLELEQLVHLQRIDKERSRLEGMVAKQAAELEDLREAARQHVRGGAPAARKDQDQQTEDETRALQVNDSIVNEYDRLLLYEEGPDLNETLSELETTRAVLEASNSQLASFRAQEAESSFQTELLKSALETAQTRIRELEAQAQTSSSPDLAASSRSLASSRREDELHEEVITWRSVAERDAKRCAALMDAVARESERASRLEETLARAERHTNQHVRAASRVSVNLSESGFSMADSATLREELETLASDMNETLQALGTSSVSSRSTAHDTSYRRGRRVRGMAQ